MPELRLLNRNEFPSTDAKRQGMVDVAYVYIDDRMRTTMITLPLEEDTLENVKAKLKEHLARAAAGGPTTVTLEEE
jgi:hypothetical protein